jgi:hemoglobin
VLGGPQDRRLRRPTRSGAPLKLKTDDFAIWLGLFRATARELCEPDVATVFIDRAERIAQSLKLAMFFRLPR